MKYQLWINNEAKSEIKQLPGHVRQRVRRAIQDLAEAPRPHDSRQMSVPEDVILEIRRIRPERWRVIYVIDEEWSEIGILAVRKRPPYNYEDLPDLLSSLEE